MSPNWLTQANWFTLPHRTSSFKWAIKGLEVLYNFGNSGQDWYRTKHLNSIHSISKLDFGNQRNNEDCFWSTSIYGPDTFFVNTTQKILSDLACFWNTHVSQSEPDSLI